MMESLTIAVVGGNRGQGDEDADHGVAVCLPPRDPVAVVARIRTSAGQREELEPCPSTGVNGNVPLHLWMRRAHSCGGGSLWCHGATFLRWLWK